MFSEGKFVCRTWMQILLLLLHTSVLTTIITSSYVDIFRVYLVLTIFFCKYCIFIAKKLSYTEKFTAKSSWHYCWGNNERIKLITLELSYLILTWQCFFYCSSQTYTNVYVMSLRSSSTSYNFLLPLNDHDNVNCFIKT